MHYRNKNIRLKRATYSKGAEIVFWILSAQNIIYITQ